MAYTIKNADGSTLLLLADNTVDKTTTSLDLIGRNVNLYGSFINNNFVKLLENFANSNPPANPQTGQLWYDTTSERLKVYSINSFKSVSGAIVATTQPSTLVTGDLWWDTTNRQLKLYSGNIAYTVGPAFPYSIGENGWVLPVSDIKDENDVTQNVTLLKNYGSLIGFISNEDFVLSGTDSLTYLNTSTTSTVVTGLTVKGNISATGKILNKNISLAVSLNSITFTADNPLFPTPGNDPADFFQYQFGNQKIIDILDVMFPIASDPSTDEVGLLVNSEARVFCEYSGKNPASPNAPNGVQMRRFRVIDNAGTLIWAPYEVYDYAFYAGAVPTILKSNIIAEIQHG